MFFLYIHCLQVAITMTPEGGSWVYPYIKISSSPYRSLTHQAQERSMSPTFFEQFLAFIVPQEPDKWKYCKMGPTVFRPYPRRLENLTVLQMSLQMQHFLLNYLKSLTLVHPGFEPATSRSADLRSPNWANQMAITVFVFHKLSFFTRLKGSDASWEHDEEPPPEVNEINYIFNCSKTCLSWNQYYILLTVLTFF